MTTLVVLFNLKPGVSAEQYEAWARSVDLPTVRKLPSVAEFQVYRAGSLLGSSEAAPYQYIEVIRLHDLQALFADIGTPVMQKVASEFQAVADAPQFIVCNALD